ncbi:MAG: 16S rRNA (adenine(1518)-N(6)/adenine(1519)-N(6))-dimethyltransferase RsmA [Oscillospiraceae bacterium]|nr:16S rRNA (adenine(1518)-N(6)/adenine(1519)-N(6))-dimethyltransferase RsmA [Oscillospiraceae bacterium]
MDLCDIGQIRALLSGPGFRFSKSMGQNFLTAAWVPERIALEAGLDGKTGVLEIGPGIGCLTVQLSRLAGKVLSVELDRALAPVLEKTLKDCENVRVIFGDVLKLDIPGLVRESFAGLKPVVCANLPYNITSPLISAFIDAGCFESMTLMVQREVARRICAKAGTGDYGAFTVYTNWYTEPEILFDVSPDCFIPAPKVWSSVIRLSTRSEPPERLIDERLFFTVVRAAFNQRRKTLVNALTSGLAGYSKETLSEAIAACGFNPLIRGEALDIAGFAAVTNFLAEQRS